MALQDSRRMTVELKVVDDKRNKNLNNKEIEQLRVSNKENVKPTSVTKDPAKMQKADL